MKQYLKMADVFKPGAGLDVQITCLTSQANNDLVAGYIQHACESHDELVAEVERLQQEVERLNSLMLERTHEPGPY